MPIIEKGLAGHKLGLSHPCQLFIRIVMTAHWESLLRNAFFGDVGKLTFRMRL